MPERATYEDANLILRLYDLRREPRMREARNWFSQSFKVQSLEEVERLCPQSSKENASFRMVTSYWEMVASMMTSGVLNQTLFFETGREMLFVWERLRDVLPMARQAFNDPTLFRNMEKVCGNFIEWLNQESPELYPTFAARVRG